MTADITSPIFHLHFEGEGTKGHTVPAVALVQAIKSLQRTIQLLAMAHEGQELKQRLKISFDRDRKYAVIFGIPQDGSYDMPYKIGNVASQLFDAQDVSRVTEQHLAVMDAIETGNIVALRRAVPSSDIRRMVVNELKKMQPPARSGLVVSIEDYRHHKLLDGRTSVDRCALMISDLFPSKMHPRLVTGRLDGLDFQARTFKLQLPTEKMLLCSYNEDFEPVLLENPREWLQVRGEAVINDDKSLKSLNNIVDIIEVDDNELIIETLEIDGHVLKAVPPFVVSVRFDPYDGFYIATGEFHLMVAAQTREEVEASVLGALAFLWNEYAIADPATLTDDALILRRDFTKIFGDKNAT